MGSDDRTTSLPSVDTGKVKKDSRVLKPGDLFVVETGQVNYACWVSSAGNPFEHCYPVLAVCCLTGGVALPSMWYGRYEVKPPSVDLSPFDYFISINEAILNAQPDFEPDAAAGYGEVVKFSILGAAAMQKFRGKVTRLAEGVATFDGMRIAVISYLAAKHDAQQTNQTQGDSET